MGKKGSKTPYIDYYISMHLGYCTGPVDAFLGMLVKDKQVHEDGFIHHVEAVIPVDKPDLFGGNLREGGMVGDVHYLPGFDTQVAPQTLADRVNRTPETMPGYRGITSLWFYGNRQTGRPGFKFSSNSPTLPPIWARFARSSQTLTNNVAVIRGQGTQTHDNNPANIIHECLVNSDWGMGGSPDMVDTVSFNYAAYYLNDESLGLSILWTRQNTIEDFIQEILNHIQGLFFFNPYTGKAHLKLLRADYDPETLPVIGPDDANLTTFRRPLWGETVNEITISWTHYQTEETETVTYQDLANIAMQGEVVSETRNFYGVRNAELASALGARELRTASTPLASATLKINRKLAFTEQDGIDRRGFLPGDCIRLTWPAYDIQNVIMRIMDINWGSPSDAEITLSLLEDIFGLPYASYGPAPETEWEPPEQDPDGPLYDEVEILFRSIPYSLISAEVGDADIDISDDMYNQIIIGMYMLPRIDQTDFHSYIAYRPTVTSSGGAAWESIGEKQTVGHTTILTDMVQEVISVIEVDTTIGGDWPAPDAIGILLTPTTSAPNYEEFREEWILFQEFLGEGEDGDRWRVRRGILDTVPAEWPAGNRLVIMSESFNGYDTSTRFADTEERYKFQVRTTAGLGDMETLGEIVTERVDRPYRPYRPANVHVGVTMFGQEDQSQNPDGTGTIFDDLHIPRDWTISCTWSRRNRHMEDLVYFRWDDADVPPEDGQTTTIILLDGNAEIGRIEGIAGTSYDLELTKTTAQLEELNLKFISVRNGLESLQGIKIGLKLYLKGYGSDWGRLYGGWPEEPISPPVTLP